MNLTRISTQSKTQSNKNLIWRAKYRRTSSAEGSPTKNSVELSDDSSFHILLSILDLILD